MSQYDPEPKSLPSVPASKGSPSGDELERSGRAIVTLIEKASQSAASKADHARGIAQKLSGELGLVERRIRELESEIAHYRDRAARAEEWLLRVSKEIQDRFFDAARPPRSPTAI